MKTIALLNTDVWPLSQGQSAVLEVGHGQAKVRPRLTAMMLDHEQSPLAHVRDTIPLTVPHCLQIAAQTQKGQDLWRTAN